MFRLKKANSAANTGHGHGPPELSGAQGSGSAAPHAYVSITYDYEYVAEDGKKIFMREGEILFLLNKTNQDWWQVIRPRDRRPFYAPAKYVMELRPEEVEAVVRKRHSHEAIIHEDSGSAYRVPPLPSMSTFSVPSAGATSAVMASSAAFAQRKRSSYSPSGSSSTSAAAAKQQQALAGMDQLIGSNNSKNNPRFQERYRSNSLDSILVSDVVATNGSAASTRRHFQHPTTTVAQLGSQAGQPGPGHPQGPHPLQQQQQHHHGQQHPSSQAGIASSSHLQLHQIHQHQQQQQQQQHQGQGQQHQLATGMFKKAGKGLIGLSSPLEKRPTFDALDKRKSWSVDNSMASLAAISSAPSGPGPAPTTPAPPVPKAAAAKSRISAYQNTAALNISPRSSPPSGSSEDSPSSPLSNKTTSPGAAAAGAPGAKPSVAAGLRDSQREKKKPVPLPRSKIPVPHGQMSQSSQSKSPPAKSSSKGQQSQSSAPKASLHSRFFGKRSKTDLGFDGLAAYKAKRPGGTKYPAPRVPAFNKPVPQKRHDIPGTSASVSMNPSARDDARTGAEDEATDQSVVSHRPEVKEKPQFSTFKQHDHKRDNNRLMHRRRAERLSKVASESDLIQSLEQEEQGGIQPSAIETVSIAISDSESTPTSSERRNSRSYFTHENLLRQMSEEAEDGTNKLIIDTSKAFKVSNDSLLSGTTNVTSSKSAPLQITTEPLNDLRTTGQDPDSAMVNSLDEELSSANKSSCSTSFESTAETDDSLLTDSRNGAEDPALMLLPSDTSVVSADLNGTLRTKSPSTSTTSRSPPSPEPLGLTPVRQHFMPDWDEYEDVQTRRKFYFNTITKEKSWKPPRRPKLSINDGQQSPASGDLEKTSEEEKACTSDSDDVEKEANKAPPLAETPDGYEYRTETDETGLTSSFYVNVFTGVRWYSAEDDCGKVYFYEENGNESCWTLPKVAQSIQDNSSAFGSYRSSHRSFKQALTGSTRRIAENFQAHSSQENIDHVAPNSVTASVTGNNKAKSARFRPRPPGPTKTEMLEQRKFALPVSSPNIQIGQVHIVVVKQGPLHKTKLIENGKRTRKNWTAAHVVLTDTFLLYFKDAKAFAAMQSGSNHGKPDLTVDLKGAAIEWCTEVVSKRRHVFEVSTVLGLTILMQDDNLQVSAEWFQEVKDVIEALNPHQTGTDSALPSHIGGRRALRSLGGSQKKAAAHEASNPHNPGPEEERLPPQALPVVERKLSSETAGTNSGVSTLQLPTKNKQTKVSRTKSLKMKILGSNEELMEASSAQVTSAPTPQSAPILPQGGAVAAAGPLAQHANRGNIREKLRKFFLRRPTMDDLFRRGIIKNEPVFGSTLRDLELADDCEVPLFVAKCITEIEKGDFMKTDGVYRQSGNLSHIQKIRLQVDQGNLAVLESVDDVHVLTGALKLFFRELREPLIPWDCVDRLLVAANASSRKQKVRQMREALATMPAAHRATLVHLLRHLLRVTELKDCNRMQIPTLAIVFGPTLMWPPATTAVSQNLALDMMQQNIIVESLLSNTQAMFGTPS